MTTPALPDCYDRPGLLTVLPLLYVAWADGNLDDDELGAINRRLARLSFVDTDCQSVIDRWLDPDKPPTPQDLHRIRRAIHARSESLPRPHRLSLVDLGLQLAMVSGDGGQPDPTEVRSLQQLARDLGLPDVAIPRPGAEPPAVEAVPSANLSHLRERMQHPFPAVRQRVLELLQDSSSLTPPTSDRDDYRDWVTTRVGELGRRGFGALAFPAELGGSDSPGAFVAAFETMAFGDLSVLVKFGVQYGLFAGAIHQLGNEEQRRQYLADAASMTLPGCFAMTETGHGSNVQGLETTATYDPETEEFVINTPHDDARKDYIGNAARDARMAVVFARLLVDENDYGVHALIARIRNDDGSTVAGVRIEDCGDKLGLNGVDNGRIWFDQVRVPRTNLLDRFGGVNESGEYVSPIPSDNKRFFTTLGALVGGRVSVALASLSVAKTALAVAIGYGNRRRQFGDGSETLILDYPSHQVRLMPLLARTIGLHMALRQLAADYIEVDEDSQRQLEADAAGLKAWASDHATRTVQEGREACGGKGYLRINRFADLKADSDVFTTFEGDNTVLMQLVAKAMLTGYRRQFAELSPVGLARRLLRQAGERVSELNPVAVHRDDSEHLRDPGFHAAALRYRQEHMLGSVAARLRRRIDNGMSASEAFLDCQVHLIGTARARIERVILERLHAALVEGEGESSRVLSLASTLLGLDLINADRGWFQEHGLLSANKAKRVQQEHETLCAELRPHASALVDTFGIPSTLLPEIALS